ncbi:MAG: argininosuccinate lyase [Actinomycetota bacterium]|nr:argininosuccinate lyase [Actinomycetota bacterium]
MSQEVQDSGQTLWHGRINEPSADALQKLNTSLSFDMRMYKEDIFASKVHASMLRDIGVFNDQELNELIAALETVETEIKNGEIDILPTDEDIHTLVERRVTEITQIGSRLHTGRSRNDQVATDLRLWTKGAITEITTALVSFQEMLLAKAISVGETMMPGYTHLQQAQPVPLAHHLLAHGWAISRDVERLIEARNRVNVSPLGAGALAGSSIPLDVVAVGENLEFSKVFENSIDAVSDRDFVADTLYSLTLLGIHLSRIGEEIILWASTEFGYVELDGSYSTGSSMMPQKKNPDIAELARGKSGRLIGDLTGFLSTLKGIPLAYNKDLQEDKEALFDAVDTITDLLPAMHGMVETATFATSRMESQASSPYMAATDLAEWMVQNGAPFREAHAVVAELVQEAISSGNEFQTLVSEHELLGSEAAELIALDSIAKNKKTHGSGGLLQLEEQIERYRLSISENYGKL